MISTWYTPDQTAPEAPFYAVIFISVAKKERPGYEEVDEELMKRVVKVPGFLGYSSTGKNQESIFISYWKDQEAIKIWKEDEKHIHAKQTGPKLWYEYYHSMICKVESSREFFARFRS